MTKSRGFLVCAFLGAIFLILLGIYLYIESKYNDVIFNAEEKSLVNFHQLRQIEDRFARHKNIDDCIYIAEKYHFLAQIAYAERSSLSPSETIAPALKGISYATTCVNLGADDIPAAFLIRFWLADMAQKVGNSELAKSNLRISLGLDKNGNLESSGWIHSAGLANLHKEIMHEQRGTHSEK